MFTKSFSGSSDNICLTIWSKSSDILKKIIRHFNSVIHKKFGDGQTEGLVQERCNSSALAVESRLSRTNPSRQFVMILNKSSTMSDGPMAFREHWNFIESTGYIKCFKMKKKSLNFFYQSFMENLWILNQMLSWPNTLVNIYTENQKLNLLKQSVKSRMKM